MSVTSNIEDCKLNRIVANPKKTIIAATSKRTCTKKTSCSSLISCSITRKNNEPATFRQKVCCFSTSLQSESACRVQRLLLDGSIVPRLCLRQVVATDKGRRRYSPHTSTSMDIDRCPAPDATIQRTDTGQPGTVCTILRLQKHHLQQVLPGRSDRVNNLSRLTEC